MTKTVEEFIATWKEVCEASDSVADTSNIKEITVNAIGLVQSWIAKLKGKKATLELVIEYSDGAANDNLVGASDDDIVEKILQCTTYMSTKVSSVSVNAITYTDGIKKTEQIGFLEIS